MRHASRLAVLGLCLVAGSGSGATWAAFSSQTSSSGNGFTAAASFCDSPGTQSATLTGDSWVDQSSSGSNKGDDSNLKVTSKSSNSNARAFVQFSLPAMPSGCSVTSAELRMYNKSPLSGRTLEAHRVVADWTESAVTWSNQPGVAADAPATATTPSSAGWMQWSVATLVAGMYSGSNRGFRIKDAVESSSAGYEQQFHSQEDGSNVPRLTVTFG